MVASIDFYEMEGLERESIMMLDWDSKYLWTVFLWRCKSYNMDEKSLEKLDNELHVKVKKCVKQKHPCIFYFSNQSSGVRY